MPTKEFEYALDDEGREWIRFRFTTEGRNVTAFLVQYETTIEGRPVPVVRYDGSHGLAHRDLLDRNGHVVSKRRLAGDPTFREALLIGERDIQQNWPSYRAAFFRNSK